jgi:hypothetical protein
MVEKEIYLQGNLNIIKDGMQQNGKWLLFISVNNHSIKIQIEAIKRLY